MDEITRAAGRELASARETFARPGSSLTAGGSLSHHGADPVGVPGQQIERDDSA